MSFTTRKLFDCWSSVEAKFERDEGHALVSSENQSHFCFPRAWAHASMDSKPGALFHTPLRHSRVAWIMPATKRGNRNSSKTLRHTKHASKRFKYMIPWRGSTTHSSVQHNMLFATALMGPVPSEPLDIDIAVKLAKEASLSLPCRSGCLDAMSFSNVICTAKCTPACILPCPVYTLRQCRLLATANYTAQLQYLSSEREWYLLKVSECRWRVVMSTSMAGGWRSAEFPKLPPSLFPQDIDPKQYIQQVECKENVLLKHLADKWHIQLIDPCSSSNRGHAWTCSSKSCAEKPDKKCVRFSVMGWWHIPWIVSNARRFAHFDPSDCHFKCGLTKGKVLT